MESEIRKAETGNGLQGREENSPGRSPGKSSRRWRALKGRKTVFLPPLQGSTNGIVVSRADALRCILSPRWGQRASLYFSAPLGQGDSKARERGPPEFRERERRRRVAELGAAEDIPGGGGAEINKAGVHLDKVGPGLAAGLVVAGVHDPAHANEDLILGKEGANDFRGG